MNNAQHLKDLLRPLGVYRLDGSFLGAELESFGGALDKAEQVLDAIQKEMCLVTADAQGLENIAGLFVRRPVTENPRQLGTALAALLRIGGDSFTLSAINDTLTGCGLKVAVSETDHPGTVEVRFAEVAGVPDGFADMKRIIEDILPAHLDIAYIFWYQTWAQIEARQLTWQALEERQITWKQLETMVD